MTKKTFVIYFKNTLIVQASRRSWMGRASISEFKVQGSTLPWQLNQLMLGEIPKNERKIAFFKFLKNRWLGFSPTWHFFVQASRRSLMGRASVSELNVRGSNLPWQWNRLKFGEIPKNAIKFVSQIFDKKMFRISSLDIYCSTA